MIKVIDEVTGTAIKIEVIGKPYQYQVRIGKVGTWKIARGRTAGQERTGEKWERPQFYGSLAAALKGTLALLSETEGIPLEHIKLSGSEAWKALIEIENKRMRLIEAVSAEFNKLVEEHGKELAGLSKFLAGKLGKAVVEDEEDPDAADEVDDAEPAEEAEPESQFPKMEARLKAEGEL